MQNKGVKEDRMKNLFYLNNKEKKYQLTVKMYLPLKGRNLMRRLEARDCSLHLL